MIIRQEREDEFPRIYDLVKIAFQTARVSNGKEQDFVNELRSGGNYIPELAMVAEDDGVLIGHIMLTKVAIVHDRERFETLLLAPISVVLERRNQGVGSTLIRESFRLAKDQGYSSVVLVGNPAYYNRFGFRASVDFGIRNEYGIPDEVVLACELIPGALRGVNGTVVW